MKVVEGLRAVPDGGDDRIVFPAYVHGSVLTAGGDMKLNLGVPFKHLQAVVPLMQQVMGATFEVTFRKLSIDEMDARGW